jgi:hypothetical protein
LAQWLLSKIGFNQGAQPKPGFPGRGIRKVLIGVAIGSRTTRWTGAAQDKDGIENFTLSCGDVRNRDRLDVQAAVVDQTKFRCCKRIRCKSDVHQVFVVFTLNWRDEGVVNFNLAIDLGKEAPGASEKDRFEMWDRHGGDHHEGEANACVHLRPRKAATKKGAHIRVWAPMFEEIGDLTFALDGGKLNEPSTAERNRTIADSTGHFPIVPAFGSERLLCFGLDLRELVRGKVALWKDICEFSQKHRVVDHLRFHRSQVGP